MDVANKAILIIGAPRSGTGITTQILQKHLGVDFPFAVNRHFEPEELVQIERNFFIRNGKEWNDRFYFPDIKPDLELYSDLVKFYTKYKDVQCVIKSPVTSLLFNWIKLYQSFQCIFVHRSVEGMAGSLIYHKKMSAEDAYQSAQWYYASIYDSKTEYCPIVTFSKDEQLYKDSVKEAVERLGLVWKDQYFYGSFDKTQIEYYK